MSWRLNKWCIKYYFDTGDFRLKMYIMYLKLLIKSFTITKLEYSHSLNGISVVIVCISWSYFQKGFIILSHCPILACTSKIHPPFLFLNSLSDTVFWLSGKLEHPSSVFYWWAHYTSGGFRHGVWHPKFTLLMSCPSFSLFQIVPSLNAEPLACPFRSTGEGWDGLILVYPCPRVPR